MHPDGNEWSVEQIKVFQNLTISKELSAAFIHENDSDITNPVRLFSSEYPQGIDGELVRQSAALWSNADDETSSDSLENVDYQVKSKTPTKDYEICDDKVTKNSTNSLSVDSKIPNSVDLGCYDAHIPYPRKISSESSEMLYLMISYFVDMSEMYFHLITEDSTKIDDMQSSLNLWCRHCEASVSEDFVKVGSCWGIQHLVDRNWYRGRVIQVHANRVKLYLKI